MPKDRLQEFKAEALKHGNTEEDETVVLFPLKVRLLNKKSSKEKKSQGDVQTLDTTTDNFLKDIEWLKDNLESLSSRVANIKSIHASITSSPQFSTEQRDNLERENNVIKKLSSTIQKELKALDLKIKADERENEEKEKAGERKIHWADLRIKKAQYRSLMQKFTTEMTHYNDHQLHYRQQCKNLIHKSLQIANRQMTDEEVEKMIEDQDPQIFSEQYTLMAAKAKLDLQELEERHNELLKLETSLREIRDLFNDVALLVDQQGELIDRVESNMVETQEFVESSVKHTAQAIINKKKANKRKACLIACGSITLLVLVLLIILSIILG